MHPFVYLQRRFQEEYGKWRQGRADWPPLPTEELQPTTAPPVALTTIDQALYALTGKVRIAFLLDDFDLPFEEMTKAETMHLRSWKASVAFLLVYERELYRVNRSGAASAFFQMMPLLRIGGVPKEQAKRLLEEPAKNAHRPFPSADTQHVLQQVGNHPYLLIRAGTTLWNLRNNLGLLSQADPLTTAQRAMLDGHLQVHCQRTFELYWEHLEPEERQGLRELAMPGKRPALDTAQAHPAWAALQTMGLLQPGSQAGAYEFVSPLFRAFVAHRSESPAAVLEPSLTGLETRLYQYLRQHQNRLCTFEELSTHVWQHPLQGPDDTEQRRRIQVAVARLRGALKKSSGEDIQSLRKQGYQLLPCRAL